MYKVIVNKHKRKTKHGSNLAVILTVIFVVLKLTDQIDWAWIWVLSPLWIGFAVGIAFFVLVIILFFIFR